MKKLVVNIFLAVVLGFFSISAIGILVSCSDRKTQSETDGCGQSKAGCFDQLYYLEKYFASCMLKTRGVEFVQTDGSVKHLNTSEDSDICLLMIEKIDAKFQVFAWDKKDGSFLGVGLIPDDALIYVFPQIPDGFNWCYYQFDLYETPHFNSEYSLFLGPRYARVIDVYGTWLKIKYTINGEECQGWIPKELQRDYGCLACH